MLRSSTFLVSVSACSVFVSAVLGLSQTAAAVQVEDEPAASNARPWQEPGLAPGGTAVPETSGLDDGKTPRVPKQSLLPPSLAYQVEIDLVPVVALGPVDVAALLKEDAERALIDKVLRYGVGRDIVVELRDGQWYELPGLGHLWIVEVIAEGAMGIRLHFSDVDLPEGAQVFVYAASDPERLAGPYGSRGPFGDGQFWTPTRFDELLRVEYFVPVEAAEDFDTPAFVIDGLQHIYRDPIGGNGGKAGEGHQAQKGGDSSPQTNDALPQPFQTRPEREQVGPADTEALLSAAPTAADQVEDNLAMNSADSPPVSFLERDAALLADGAVEERRAAYGRYYSLPDGRKAALVSSAPVHYLGADGMFHPVDETIVPLAPGTDYAYTNAASFFEVYFPGVADHTTDMLFRAQSGIELRLWSGGQLWYEDGQGGRELLYEAGSSIAIPERNTVLYPERYPNIAEAITVKYEGVKHNYVLDALPSWLEQRSDGVIELSEVVTLPPDSRLVVHGVHETADFLTSTDIHIVSETGTPIGVFPAPFSHEGTPGAYDPELHARTDLQYRVAYITANVVRLGVRVPVAWLTNPTRTYPVSIDPSSYYYENHSYDDCYSWGAELFNYSADYMKVGYNSDFGVPYYLAFMTFHDVDIPPGSTVDLVQHWWRAYDNYSNTCSFKWQFEDSDDAERCANEYPAGRDYVSHYGYISPYTTSWSSGSWYGVQDLSPGLQDVIDRSGWSSGNNVGLKWCAYSASGGYRLARSYDYGSSSAPYLYVEYTPGSSEHCYDCPTYDYSITPQTYYQTHADSFDEDGCRWYRAYLDSGWDYTFTVCEGGGSFSDDTVFDLYNDSCGWADGNDDTCGWGSEIVYRCTSSGYYYLRVRGYGWDAESYTLAYKKERPFDPPSLVESGCYVAPTEAEPGESVTVYYRIYNPNSTAVTVGLGCSIIGCTTPETYHSPNCDRYESVPPGEHTYSRCFDIPTDAVSQLYDVIWCIWEEIGVEPPWDCFERSCYLEVGCRIDVTCYPAWEDVARACAGIGWIDSDSLWCSGQMLNNLDSDLTPYWLTANHCLSSQSDAQSAEIYWLYQTSTCNGSPPPLSSVPQSAVCTLLSTGSASDYTLLMVEGELPSGLYWAGWTSASISNGTTCTGIHHPAGTHKRISFGPKTSTTSTHHWIGWSEGGTEGGSSGSGIFKDSTEQLFGQLSGNVPDCWFEDNYGRFDVTYPDISGFLAGGSDDYLEENDTCSTSTSVGTGSYPDLIVKSVDEDWYEIAVAGGGTLDADVFFTDDFGDIDIRLYDACGGSIVASSTSTTDNESISYMNPGGTADFYLRVYLYSDTRNDYDMTIQVDECVGDIDGDGDTDHSDLGELLSAWCSLEGDPNWNPSADLDGDGHVGHGDLGILLADWGCSTSP